jgi:hypothetical protein
MTFIKTIILLIFSFYFINYCFAFQSNEQNSDKLVKELIKLDENSNDLELKKRSQAFKESFIEEQRLKKKVLQSQGDLEI